MLPIPSERLSTGKSVNELRVRRRLRRATRPIHALSKIILCEAPAIGNALRANRGVFLVEPGLYGLHKHFKLPVSQ
jgi:hypothetical protein